MSHHITPLSKLLSSQKTLKIIILLREVPGNLTEFLVSSTSIPIFKKISALVDRLVGRMVDRVLGDAGSV